MNIVGQHGIVSVKAKTMKRKALLCHYSLLVAGRRFAAWFISITFRSFMFHSRWRCFAAFMFVICSLPLFTIESKAAAEIQKQKHFQLASDPSKADVVCVLIAYWGPVFFEGKSIWNRTAGQRFAHPPAALMIFKGGNSPQGSAFPLWMKTAVGNPVDVLEDLNRSIKSIEKKKTKASAGSAQDTPEGPAAKVEGSVAKEEAGSLASQQSVDSASPGNGDAANENHSDSARKEEKDPSIGKVPEPAKVVTVFCQSDFKTCSPAPVIYSASTLLICDSHNRCNNENMRRVLQPGGRWSLVSDPGKADLIVILSDDSVEGLQPGGIVGGAKFSTMYLFKGGTQPDWQAMPLFATVGGGGMFSTVKGSTGGTVLQRFQKFISDTDPSVAQTSGQQK